MPNGPLGFPEYDDPIVIRFEIPWLRKPAAPQAGAGWREPNDGQRDSGRPEHSVSDPHQASAPDDNADTTWPPPRIIMADVKGHPSLAVSGLTSGELRFGGAAGIRRRRRR